MSLPLSTGVLLICLLQEEDKNEDGFLFRPPAPTPFCQVYYATPQFKCLRIESQHTQTAFRGRFQDPLIMQTHQQQPRESWQLPNPKLKVPIVSSWVSSPAPGVSGSAVIAQRATSPAPKKGSHGSTPSGNHGQRASSPLAHHARLLHLQDAPERSIVGACLRHSRDGLSASNCSRFDHLALGGVGEWISSISGLGYHIDKSLLHVHDLLVCKQWTSSRQAARNDNKLIRV